MNGRTRNVELGAIAATAVAVLLAQRTITKPTRAAEQTCPHLPGERHIDPQTGIAYRYIHQPDAEDTTPVVLIHGWAGSADTTWYPLVPLIATDLITVDLPGHGHSAARHPFSIPAIADDIASLTARTLKRPAIYVGYSLGGPVAMTLTRRHPEVVHSLIGVATGVSWEPPTVRALTALAPAVIWRRSRLWTWNLEWFMYHHKNLAGYTDWLRGATPPHDVLIDAAAALRAFDATEWAATLDRPVECVITEHDHILPPEQQERAATTLHAVVHHIDSNHALVATHTRQLADIINHSAGATTPPQRHPDSSDLPQPSPAR